MTPVEKIRHYRVQIMLSVTILGCLATATTAYAAMGHPVGLITGALALVVAWLLIDEIREYIAARKDTRP